MNGPRSLVRSSWPAPRIIGAALILLGPAPSTARGQWIGGPGLGYAGLGYGGFGYGGFGYPGLGYGGFGYPGLGNGGFGYGGLGYAGYGMYPGPFSVLNQPSVQAGLAYQSLATGRMAPYSYNANPLGFGAGPGFGGGPYIPGFGPFGFAGTAFSNPYFSSGLTPLAVQSAMDEMALSRAAQAPLPAPPVLPSRIRVIDDPARRGRAVD